MSTQIHDLGYRSYEGQRSGVPWAVRSLALHSVRRALGLKRAVRHKIVPAVTLALAFLPAIINVGIAILTSDIGLSSISLVSYGDYFNFTGFAIFLFAAIAAPGVLTTDRTNGMFALYLASPLTRTTYVLAKAIGIFSVMLLATVAPIVFLVLAYTLVGAGPGGVVDFIELLLRATAAGTLAALTFTGIGMFIASIPKRWGLASVAIVASVIVPGVVLSILTEEAQASKWLMLASPFDMLVEAWQHIIGDPIDGGFAVDELGAGAVIVASVMYATTFLALTWWRYQNVEVDR